MENYLSKVENFKVCFDEFIDAARKIQQAHHRLESDNLSAVAAADLEHGRDMLQSVLDRLDIAVTSNVNNPDRLVILAEEANRLLTQKKKQPFT